MTDNESVAIVERERREERDEQTVPVASRWAQVGAEAARLGHVRDPQNRKSVERVPGIRDARGRWVAVGEVGLFELGHVEADRGLLAVAGEASNFAGARRREIVTVRTIIRKAQLVVDDEAAQGPEPSELRIHPLADGDYHRGSRRARTRLADATDAEVEAWASDTWDLPCSAGTQKLINDELKVREARRAVLEGVAAEESVEALRRWAARIANMGGYVERVDDLALGSAFTPVLQKAIKTRLRQLEAAGRKARDETQKAALEAAHAAARKARPAPASWTPAPLDAPAAEL